MIGAWGAYVKAALYDASHALLLMHVWILMHEPLKVIIKVP